jgi:hypothetical protein
MKINYNILMGILSIITLSFIFAIFMPLVSSDSLVINTFMTYEDASATSKTVTQGDYVNLYLVAYAHGEALAYERLELVSSTLLFSENIAGENIETYTWLYTKSPYVLNTGILNPGTYTLRFTARTATTQSEEYSDLQLIILPEQDTIKPVVDLLTPIATTYTSHRISLTFNVYDDNLKACTYKLDGGNSVPLATANNGHNAVIGITSVKGINTWSVTCVDDSGNIGTDSVTFNVIIEEPPICGDGTCNGVENCSTCPTDCGTCPPPNPDPRCDLTNAHWSVSSALTGQVVSLIVQGSDCNGKTIDFTIYQDKFVGDVYVANTATSVVSNGIASSNWVAVAPSTQDGDTTPTYYFIAKVLGDTESATSGYLQVTMPLTCGDGKCNGAETCSTCPTDCGVCPDNIKPVVDITYPIATTYTSQRTNLIFSVHDDNLKSCTYKLNNNPSINVASLVNGVNTVTGITSITGINTWSVTCVDDSGNIGSDSVVFRVNIEILPTCGDGKCNGAETCSTCPTDCGVCPKNCTICKDSKPLDDNSYDYLNYLNKKTTVIIDETDLTDTSAGEKEKSIFKSNPILISLILILGIVMLLLIIAILKAIKRRN